MTIHTDASKRHDAVLFFDVTDGNPNGDPDADNLPRVDPETMQGLVTDVAIKRKIRDFVDTVYGREERYKIYVQSGQFLSDKQERAYSANSLKKGSKEAKDHLTAQRWMCENFFDIRAFGAVMGVTDYRAGQVRGPVQLTFARSVDSIIPLDLSIVRIALTSQKEERQGTDVDAESSSHGTMGRKALVPYGLYKANIFVSPQLAAQTGFDNDDLAIFWDALVRMWDFDRSASRGMMACRGLYVFSHDNPFGNAPAHTLLERLTATRKADVTAPREFGQYDVQIPDDGLPEGVTLTRLVA